MSSSELKLFIDTFILGHPVKDYDCTVRFIVPFHCIDATLLCEFESDQI